MFVYQCEDSMEGIFTAVYNAYEDKRKPEEVMICCTDELFLFAEYIPVEIDLQKVQKVIRTLKRRFGERDYYNLCLAISATHERKAQAIYRTIVKGLSAKCFPGHLLDDLSDESVHLVFSLGRAAGREYDHLRGFLRFEELEQGVLFAKVAPKNNILEHLMNHFADRFPVENFMIYDEARKVLGIHEAGMSFGEYESLVDRGLQGWYLVQCDKDMEENLSKESDSMKRAEEEFSYQHLFQYFCQKIAIKERENRDLQRNMLPLRFRGYMTEFKQEQ